MTQAAPAQADPIGWVDPASYPDLAPLVARWQIVRNELQGIVDSGCPWLHFTDNDSVAALQHRSQAEIDALIRPRLVPLTDAWPHKLFPLMRERHVFPEAAQLCPQTTALVAAAPAAFNAAFAALEAGGTIAPHQGSSDRVDRCHLALVIPGGDVKLRVSGVPRGWTEGEMMIFDDRSWHEAWNRTGQRRFVLIVDVEKAGATNRRPLRMEEP